MRLPGDPEGCAALGASLQRAASGAVTAERSESVAQSNAAGWQGSAAASWQDSAARNASRTSELARAMHLAGRALCDFAEALRQAQALAARAGDVAAQQGLTLLADGWIPSVGFDFGAAGPAEREALTRTALAAAAVRDDALRLVALAQAAETAAHERLAADLRGALACPVGPGYACGTLQREPVAFPLSPFPSAEFPSPRWSPLLHPVPWTLPMFGGRGDVGGRESWMWDSSPPNALDAAGWANSARLAPRYGAALAQELASKSSGSRAAQLQAKALDYGYADDWLHSPRTWITDGAVPRVGSTVLRRLPVVSTVLVGVGIQQDHRDGMGWGQAATKNVGSAAAGTLAALGTGALVVGMGTATVVAAPVVVGVVVGAVVAYGIGHYGDDVGRGAPRTASASKDAVVKGWKKVFG